jgi:hypothetical protein
MRRSKGVSTFVATLILVSITLSLSYVVYEGVSRIATPEPEVYTNQVSQIGGSPGLAEVIVNASSPATPVAFETAGVSSQTGVLFFDGTRYGTSNQLCMTNATTFFSVLTGSGVIRADGNGKAWIDGYWVDSLDVQAGWQEVMFSDASSCTVTLASGSDAAYPGADVSTLPIIGELPSSSFVLYVPSTGSLGSFLMVFDGSYDRIA